MNIKVGNAQHIGKRPEQQDAFGFSDPKDHVFLDHGGFLGVVADGVGGMANGRAASRAAVRTFLDSYQAKAPNESIISALARSFDEANRAVVSLDRSVAPEEGTGTTFAAAVIHKNSLYWVSAGDSRIYLLRKKTLTQITEDHIYARELDREAAEGRITREEARKHPQRNNLTNFLGMEGKLEVDHCIRPVALDHGDCVILCSDGIYRAVSEEEICAAFRGDLNDACDLLMQLAVRKNRARQDNLTVIAFSSNGKRLPGHGKWNSTSRRKLWIISAAAFTLFTIVAVALVLWPSRHSKSPTVGRSVGTAESGTLPPSNRHEKGATSGSDSPPHTTGARGSSVGSNTQAGRASNKNHELTPAGRDAATPSSPSSKQPAGRKAGSGEDSSGGQDKAGSLPLEPNQLSKQKSWPTGKKTPGAPENRESAESGGLSPETRADANINKSAPPGPWRKLQERRLSRNTSQSKRSHVQY
jgi:protein phosphatase